MSTKVVESSLPQFTAKYSTEAPNHKHNLLSISLALSSCPVSGATQQNLLEEKLARLSSFSPTGYKHVPTIRSIQLSRTYLESKIFRGSYRREFQEAQRRLGWRTFLQKADTTPFNLACCRLTFAQAQLEEDPLIRSHLGDSGQRTLAMGLMEAQSWSPSDLASRATQPARSHVRVQALSAGSAESSKPASGDAGLVTSCEQDYCIPSKKKVEGPLVVRLESVHGQRRIRLVLETSVFEHLILHWGVISHSRRNSNAWEAPPPSIRPKGTHVLKDAAAQTKFVPCAGEKGQRTRQPDGTMQRVEIEIDERDAPCRINFVLKDEESGRWINNHGRDFVVNLPEPSEGGKPENGDSDPAPSATAGSASEGAAAFPVKEKEAANFLLEGDRFRTEENPLSGLLSAFTSLFNVGTPPSSPRGLPSRSNGASTRGLSPWDGSGDVWAQEQHALHRKVSISHKVKVRVTPAEGEERMKVRVRVETDLEAPLLLHWGVVRRGGNQMDWRLPRLSDWPPQTEEYKGKALQTPLEISGGGQSDAPLSSVTLILSTRYSGVRFVLKSAHQNVWYDNGGHNFFVQLPIVEESRRDSEQQRQLEVQRAELERQALVDFKGKREAQGTGSEVATAETLEEYMERTREESGRSAPSGVDISQISFGPSSLSEPSRSQGERVLAEAPGVETPPAATMSARLNDRPAVKFGAKQASETVIRPPNGMLPLTEQQLHGWWTDDSPSSGTASGQEILFHGFNWESHKCGCWYDVLSQHVDEIADMGFTLVWLPPPTSSVSPQGYMPLDLYNLNSRYGSMESLKQLVRKFHSRGVAVLGDAVLNHRCAAQQDENGVWNVFGGKLAWDSSAIVGDDPNFKGRGNLSTGDNFHAAPNIDHSQDFVRRDIRDWLLWLRREVGFDGWRLDYVRGFSGTFVREYMESSQPWFSVGELWDSLSYTEGVPDYDQDSHRQRIVDWMNDAGGHCAAFDVTTKGILHAVMEKGEYHRLRDPCGRPPGVMGFWPSRAVTFIENHDTGSTQGHWRFPPGKELQGYAYILTHPGTPCVFYDHLFSHHKSALHALIALRRRAQIQCRSQVDILRAEHGLYVAKIDERLIVKLGSSYYEPPSGHKDRWHLATEGPEYRVWERV